jgi:hypothetical protein
MRVLAVSLFALMAAPASAQQVGMIGPTLSPADVTAARFDVVFEVKVTAMPSLPVLVNQTAEARWDGVICNVSKANRGAVKVEPTARFGYLDPNVCTMFSSFRTLDLTTVEADKEWTAKVFLRARQ